MRPGLRISWRNNDGSESMTVFLQIWCGISAWSMQLRTRGIASRWHICHSSSSSSSGCSSTTLIAVQAFVSLTYFSISSHLRCIVIISGPVLFSGGSSLISFKFLVTMSFSSLRSLCCCVAICNVCASSKSSVSQYFRTWAGLRNDVESTAFVRKQVSSSERV